MLLLSYASSISCRSNSFYTLETPLWHINAQIILLLAIFAINCAIDPLTIAFLLTSVALYKFVYRAVNTWNNLHNNLNDVPLLKLAPSTKENYLYTCMLLMAF